MNCRIKNTKSGEKSIPPVLKGEINLLKGLRAGSVIATSALTMGLYGSGETQEMSALTTIIHL